MHIIYFTYTCTYAYICVLLQMCVQVCRPYIRRPLLLHCLHYRLLCIFLCPSTPFISCVRCAGFFICVYLLWDVSPDTKILMNIKDPLTPLVHSSSNPFITHTFICIYDPSNMIKVLVCKCTNKILPLQAIGIGLRRVAVA